MPQVVNVCSSTIPLERVRQSMEGEPQVIESVPLTANVDPQPWPSGSTKRPCDLCKTIFSPQTCTLQMPPGISVQRIATCAFALLLSVYRASRTVDFAVQLAQAIDSSDINGVVGDISIHVDQSLRVVDFIAHLSEELATPPHHQALDKHAGEHQNQADAHTSRNNQLSSTSLVVRPAKSRATSQDLDEQLRHSTFDLLIDCTTTGSSFAITTWYNPNALTVRAAERFASHFTNIAAGICNAAVDSLVRDVAILSPQDISEIVELAGPSQPSIEDVFSRRFEDQVCKRPQKMAIESWDGSLSYSELLKASEGIAQRLVHHGVHRGDRVPICMPKSKFYTLAVLAVLRLGAAFVPLDPAHPIARLESITKQLSARIVLTSTALSSMWIPVIDNTLALDDTPAESLMSQESLPPIWQEPNSLAYVIFTSGSTGQPKGVEIEHRAYLSGATARAKAIQRNEDSRVFQFCSHAFDATIEDILTTLLVGGTVCIPSESEKQTDFEGAATKYRANCADLTPALVSALLPENMPTLRTLIVGGEAVGADIIHLWAPYVDFIITYGPTECSIVATATTPRTLDSNHLDVGPTYGCRPWIVDVDDSSRLLPIGAAGELILDGPIVARGYFNDPSRTVAAFMSSLPWSNESTRAYKTGDVARLTEDGRIEYLHRKDTMVKLDGQRLELSDVEVNVRRYLRDRPELVIAVDIFSHNDVKHLALFFQSSKQADAAPQARKLSKEETELCRQLKQDLNKVLPTYMVPSTFISFTRFPITASHKVDRLRMRTIAAGFSRRRLEHHKLATHIASHEPLTETETKVRAIWAQVLQVPEGLININSDFIALGGNSIRIMRLATFMKRAGLAISVADIFRNSQLRAMVARSRTKSLVPAANNPLPLQPLSLLRNPAAIVDECIEQRLCSSGDEISDAYPCTPFQESVIAASCSQPGAYTWRQIITLRSVTDVARLRTAWDRVIAAHPILRSIMILSKNEGSLQVVMKDLKPWRTCKSLAEYDAMEASHPMSYLTPLLRLSIVYDTNEQLPYLAMTIHHAIYDAESFTSIQRHVVQIYNDINDQIPQTTPFRDFVGLLLSTDRKDESKKFWQGQLAGHPATQLVEVGANKPKTRTEQKMRASLHLNSAGLAGVTVATHIRAAWALTMSSFSASLDVLFGVTSTGRNVDLDGILDIVGPTMATLPARITIDETLTLHQFLSQVQRQGAEMIAHEHYGMRELSRLNPAAREFQTILTIKSSDEASADDELFGRFSTSKSMESEPARQGSGFYLHPLMLDMRIENDSITVHATFDENTIPAWRLRSVLDTLRSILYQIMNCDQQRRVNDLNYCSPEDARKIESWNQSILHGDRRLIHSVIQSQRSQTPSSIAIHAWDGIFSYAELDDTSSFLAVYLSTMRDRIQGPAIGSPIVIPLCFERSCFMVIAVLAVLKAGWSYVALDTNNPDRRLLELCSQIGATLILCGSAQFDRVSKLDLKTLLKIDRNFLASSRLTSATTLAANITPADTALVVFTSGSTGLPKPIPISHQAFCSCARDFGVRMNFSRSTRLLQNAAYAFDMHACEIFFTLMFGGTLFLANDDRSRLIENIARWNINWLFMSPSATELISSLDAIPSIRTITLAGEAPNSEQYARLCDPSLTLINVYGPAENTLFTAMQVVTSKSMDPRQIGKGVNTHTWICHPDNVNKILPIGAVGELLIEGPQLANGYINRRLETDRAFVNRPRWEAFMTKRWSYSNDGPTLYRTGDLVHYLADGSLRIVGRVGSQIKLRGQRLELEEVEHHIRNLAGTQKVAADICITASERQLLACIVEIPRLNVDAEPSSILPLNETLRRSFTEMRMGLMEQLPSFMVPSLYIPVGRLPETLSGKLDRKTMKHVLSSMLESDIKEYALNEGSKAQPTTPAERFVQRLWAEVLRIPEDHIGLYDSFFALGGDSIAAIQLAAAVTRTDPTSRLTVKDILASPQLRSMVSNVVRADVKTAPSYEAYSLLRNDIPSMLCFAANSLNCLPSSIRDIYPCSPLQEAMFTTSLREPGAYVSQHVFRLPYGVNMEKLRHAWSKLVSQTDILRTRIVIFPSGEPMQVILQPTLAGTSTLVEFILHPDQKPFEIASGRTLHRAFCQESREGQRSLEFIWEASHALFDAWSLRLTMEHLEILYCDADTSLKNTNYGNFITHLERLDKPASEAYWRKTLNGSSAPIFPPDPVSKLAEIRLTISRTLQVPKFSHPRITFPTLIQAAWALLLARKHSQNDLIFGTTLTGRNARLNDIDSVLGPTICTVPRRVRINLDDDVHSLLEQIHINNIEGIPFEQLGLQNILRLFPQNESMQPRSLLIIHADQRTSCELFEEVATPNPAANNYYPLVVAVNFKDTHEVTRTDVEIECSFDSALISEWELSYLIEQLLNVISQMVNIDSKLRCINMSAGSGEELILSEMGEVTPVVDGNILNVVWNQFQENHGQPAVSDEYGELTYGELSTLVSALSVHLQANDLIARPGIAVALYFTASKWSVVATLAVLAAGGTCSYVRPEDGQPNQTIPGQTAETLLVLTDLQNDAVLKRYRKVLTINETTISMLPKQRGISTPEDNSVACFAFEREQFEIPLAEVPSVMVMSHKQLYTWWLRMCNSLPFGPGGRVLLTSANGSIRCFLDALCTLAVGGCLCIHPADPETRSIEDVINSHKVTVVIRPPSGLRQVKLERCPSVKSVLFYGEVARYEDVSGDIARISFYSMYCPAVWPLGLSVTKLTAQSDPEAIGRIQALASVILDPSDLTRNVPLGWTGQLCLRLERDSPSVEKSLLNTHDLVRITPDQNLQLINSTKIPSILRGQAIPLGHVESTAVKIEASLLDCTAQVCSAQIAAMPDECLVLFVIMDSKRSVQESRSREQPRLDSRLNAPELANLRAKMPQALPHPAVPTMYVPVTCLPRNGNGCIDRGALQSLVASLSPDETAQCSANSPTSTASAARAESRMARLWADTLGIEIDILSANSRWASLGGDSILAMRLNAVAKAAGFFITVADILSKTLSELDEPANRPSTPTKLLQHSDPSLRISAAFEDYTDLAAALRNYTGCDREDVEDIAEATDYQCTMFCSGMLAERGWDHHVTLDFSPDISVDAIERACHHLLATHGILRTVFVPFRGRLLQAVLSNARIDLTRIQTSDIEASVEQWIIEDRKLPVSYTSAVVRAAAISDEIRLRRLIIGISHAQHDAFSLALLHADLDKTVRGEVLCRPSLSFINYVRVANASFTPKAEAYWRQNLRGSFPTALVYHQKPLYQNRIQAPVFCRQLALSDNPPPRFTLATIVKAAWAYVLSQWTSSDDVVFGSLVSGRSFRSSDVSDVVGPCLNIIPTRVRWATSCTSSELLEQIHAAHLAAIPFEANGYQRIIACCTDWPAWTRFSSIVHHQQVDRGAAAAAATSRMGIRTVASDSADLWINTVAQSATLSVQLVCSAAVLPIPATEVLGSHLSLVIEHLLHAASTLSGAAAPAMPPAPTFRVHMPTLPIKLSEPRSPPNGANHGPRERIRAVWRAEGLDPDCALHEQAGGILLAVTLAQLYRRIFPGHEFNVDDLIAAETAEGHARIFGDTVQN